MLTDGLHMGVPAAEYHKKQLGVVSKSALDRIKKSPAHYRSWLELETKETPAMTFGRMLHCATLEPAVFAATHAVQPDFGDCRYKEAKANRDAWRADNAGRIAVDQDDHAAVVGISRSLLAHPAASLILREGVSEVTVRWTDPLTGLPGKSRADYYVESKSLVADLKSTEDASDEGFAKSVYKYRYHVQDALYRLAFSAVGKPIDHFALIAVEKEPPYAVSVYTLDDDAVQRGYAAARVNMERLADCLATNEWPAYSTGVQELSLPRWAA